MQMRGTVINRPSTWRGTRREVGAVSLPTAGLPNHPGSTWSGPASPLHGRLATLLVTLVVGLFLTAGYVAIVAAVHWAVQGKGHRLPLFALITLVGSVVVSGCIGLCLARRQKRTDRSS